MSQQNGHDQRQPRTAPGTGSARIARRGFAVVLLAVVLGAGVLAGGALGESAGESAGGPIHHVVICWLKAPGDAEARAAVIEASRTLEAIPGVQRVQAGEVVPSERSVVDSSFDVGLVITVDDADALASYIEHPIHQKALETTIKPLVERYIVYDLRAPSSP